MKMVILIVLVMAGGVLHADAVFARGGAGGGGAPGGGGGTGGGPAGGGGAADGGSVPGDTGTAAATGPDSSALETGPGDRLGGPSAGYDPSIYHSPATAWPGEIEYLSASPRDPAVVAPPAAVAPTAVIVTPQSAVVVQSPARVDIRATPLMCPGINASDPRKC